MRQALDEYAKTFFTLLAAGSKLETYEKRMALTVSMYPHMDEEHQENVRQSLTLPDDVLNDILEEENVSDFDKIKEVFEEGSDGN